MLNIHLCNQWNPKVKKTYLHIYTYIWCRKVQECWKTLLLGSFLTWSLILLHERMTSFKCYLRYALNIWCKKHNKITQLPLFFRGLVEKKLKHFSKFSRGFTPHSLLLAPLFRKAKQSRTLRFLVLCCKSFGVLLPFHSSTSHVDRTQKDSAYPAGVRSRESSAAS